MILKRHLLFFGPNSFPEANGDEKKEQQLSSMGEDERWEAFPKDSLVPRTWWRKWLKLK